MEPIGTPAVKTTLTHDLYLTLMSVSGDGAVGRWFREEIEFEG